MERWLPLAIVTLGFGFGIVGRGWLQRRRTGSSGIMLFRNTRKKTQIAWDLALIVTGLTMTGQAARFAADAGAIRLLAQPAWLPGTAVAVAGLIGMCVAQLQLGNSWRVGIDWGARPGLVSHGLYRWSRNPIFTGLLVALAGYALLLPTLLSAAALAVAIVGIRTQVIDEERYLRTTYGDEFLAYAARVGRFVPGLGRLRH